MRLERTLESSLDCKEIQPVHPKGNQSWIFIGRTDAEAETAILWPPDAKSWLIWKDPDAGKDWGQEEKGTIENEMVGWHHWFNGHGFGWTPGVSDGQRSLACCSPWGCKESDTTEQLHWTELRGFFKLINFCLCKVFVAVHGLSLVAGSGASLWSLGAHASHCGAFSCCGATAQGMQAQ